MKADKGCEFSPSCLDCPLEMCILDSPYSAGKQKKMAWNQQIRKFKSEGKSQQDIATAFNIGIRTVQRVLQ